MQPAGVNGDAVDVRRRGRDELVATGTGRHRASLALAVKLHWALRIGVALEFLGHGLAGFYRPPGWIPYFMFFGIPETFANDHMTYITGTVDIVLAIVLLLRPMRAVMLHMAVWGLLTALLRPLTGESWFELAERGANYGMPLALLVLSGWGGRSLRSWFEPVGPPKRIGRELVWKLAWIARASIALLLVGHGGLGIWAAKQEWFDFLRWFGVADSSQAVNLMIWVGVFEVVLGLAVLIKPVRGVVLFVLVWKVGTDLLRPLVGQPNYQFVERAGDYVLPLALFWLASTVGRAVPGNGRGISTPERVYEGPTAAQAGRGVLVPGVVLAAGLGSLSQGTGSPNP
jgi:uncharacterized membrane protein HdeD (DUF308 family)